MTTRLEDREKRALLRLARAAMEAAVRGERGTEADLAGLPPALAEPGACFVTLMRSGDLRGCIGGLWPERPLADEVCQRAAQAALSDYRFMPVAPDELPEVEIEVSVLTPPQGFEYDTADDLARRLRPGVDGVILRQGLQRATFLPQVWERVPEPERFLSMLCEKLGARPDAWRRSHLEVMVYQVEKFTEAEFRPEPGIDYALPRPPD
jgi:AmmeMemoRadiSam system protein A